jgi:hypothetical protein
MSAARRRLTLMLAGFFASLAGVLLLGWVVNPLGIWRTRIVDPRYRSDDATSCNEVQRERVTMPYRVRFEHPSVVLLGSSRVQCGMAMPMDGRDGYLNAGLRGASLPELTALLELATGNPALRRVVIGVDFFAFGAPIPAYQDRDWPERLRNPLAHAWRDAAGEIRHGLLTTDSLFESLRTLTRRIRGAPRLPWLLHSPWTAAEIRDWLMSPPVGLREMPAAELTQRIASIAELYRGYQPAPSSAADGMRAAIATLRARGVDVRPLVFPMSGCELAIVRRLGLWDAFLTWRRALPGIVGPYWDFATAPTAVREEGVFVDTMHVRRAVGQALLRSALGLGCAGCGEPVVSLVADGIWVDRVGLGAEASTAALELLPATRCARSVDTIELAAP